MINIDNISKLSEDELIELHTLVEQNYLESLRYDFWKFCLYWDEEFFTKRPFTKRIADGMQKIADRKIRRLGISLPPRAAKSYLASLFSAWMLGRDPKGSVMRNSCTTTLYNKFSYDVRDMVLDVRFKRVFPYAKISPNKTSVTGWNMEDSRQVGYFGGGVGSTILGFGCDLVAILDDPIKDVEEALSEHVLEKKWDWYTGVHRSRLENQCPEIHIATRWSRRDIIGRLEELGEFDETIVVPALDDNDETFCEDVATSEEYRRTREITAPFIFQSEYQQKPVEVKGLLYPRDELKYFDINTFRRSDNTVAVVDVADTGSDYLACAILNMIDDKAYLVDVVFTQEPIEVTESAVAAALIKNKVTLCRIESNSGGRSFARNVENILRAQGATTTIEAKPTTQNKGTRMLLKSGMVKEFIYFRDDKDMNTDYKQFMQQLCSTFKDVSKNKHDDAADSITMGAEVIEEKTYNNWVVTL